MAKLNVDYPEARHLLMKAEGKCCSEMFERYHRQLTKASPENRLPMGLDFNPLQPWIGVFTHAARNKDFWDEHVISPAIPGRKENVSGYSAERRDDRTGAGSVEHWHKLQESKEEAEASFFKRDGGFFSVSARCKAEAGQEERKQQEGRPPAELGKAVRHHSRRPRKLFLICKRQGRRMPRSLQGPSRPCMPVLLEKSSQLPMRLGKAWWERFWQGQEQELIRAELQRAARSGTRIKVVSAPSTAGACKVGQLKFAVGQDQPLPASQSRFDQTWWGCSSPRARSAEDRPRPSRERKRTSKQWAACEILVQLWINDDQCIDTSAILSFEKHLVLPEELIERARTVLHDEFKVNDVSNPEGHRTALLRCMLEQACDLDAKVVPDWLDHGVPLGVSAPIVNTGIFPATEDVFASIKSSQAIGRLLEDWSGEALNYSSFYEAGSKAQDELDRIVETGRADRVCFQYAHGLFCTHPAFQSEWELLTIFLAVRLFSRFVSNKRVHIVVQSDSTSALEAATKFKAHSPIMVRLACELGIVRN